MADKNARPDIFKDSKTLQAKEIPEIECILLE
jgi:hypothetical protein